MSEWKELAAAAMEARKQSYCPYSKFAVGAAVLSETGQIFRGCNVENVSYGLTICAERVAITKAVSDGVRRFRAIAVAADLPGGEFCTPCGGCLPVICEFPTLTHVISVKPDGEVKVFEMRQLMPQAFTKFT